MIAGDSPYYMVGTAFVNLDEPEPTKGRLLVVGEGGGSEGWTQLSSIEIGGCPYAVTGVGSSTHVAAAINSQVSGFGGLGPDKRPY